MSEVATKPTRTRLARAPTQARPQISAVPRRAPRRISGPVRRPARVARRPSRAERVQAWLRRLPEHALLDRLVRGRVWIPLLGVMLGGIVAMQVELLKLNASTGRSVELASALQSRNEILRAQVAADSAPGRIERLGLRMGMIMPGPEAITFLKARSASPGRAAALIRPPDNAAFQAALQATNTATAGSMPILAPASSTTSTSSTPSKTTTSSTPTAPSAIVP